jgi:transmembrane sensor
MAAARQRSVDDRIAEEAAGWVARLQSSDASERDRRDFDLWAARDPAHRMAYDELRGLWTDLGDVPLPAGHLRETGGRRRRLAGNILALGLIAILSAALYQMGLIDRMRADHYTVVGSVRSLRLDDGTRVDLNTDTAIAVRYSDRERRVELLRGEAFFDVARQAERPFVVSGAGMQATALGTRYGMRTASAGSAGDVQVEEGRVEVVSGNNRVVLGADGVASLSDGGRLTTGSADVAGRSAWRSGKLVFSGQPLGEVLATLQRYRLGRIIVLDQAAAARHVSGIFDLNDTDEALRVIESSLPVTVTRLTGMIILVRSR